MKSAERFLKDEADVMPPEYGLIVAATCVVIIAVMGIAVIVTVMGTLSTSFKAVFTALAIGAW